MKPLIFGIALSLGLVGSAVAQADKATFKKSVYKDNVEPVKSSREMVAALKKAGGSPKYTEYPNDGHNVWDKTYKNGKVIEWLFAQKHK